MMIGTMGVSSSAIVAQSIGGGGGNTPTKTPGNPRLEELAAVAKAVGDTVAVAFCGKTLADLGADVIMVEPTGGRRLRPAIRPRAGRLRGKVDECLQFALAHDFLDCFTIGGESRTEFEDLIRRIPAASVRG